MIEFYALTHPKCSATSRSGNEDALLLDGVKQAVSLGARN